MLTPPDIKEMRTEEFPYAAASIMLVLIAFDSVLGTGCAVAMDSLQEQAAPILFVFCDTGFFLYPLRI